MKKKEKLLINSLEQDATKCFGQPEVQITKKDKSLQDGEQPNTLKVHLVVVLDTNIFLEPFGYKICDYFTTIPPDSTSHAFQTEITFLIPWIVMQELNAIKENRSLRRSYKLVADARNIISLLFKIFTKHKWPKKLNNSSFSIGVSFKGQSVSENEDKSKVTFVAECEDDAILQCCLTHIANERYPNFDPDEKRLKTVILLTNDKGLGIKALANNVTIYDLKELGQETTVNFAKITKFDVSTFSRVIDFLICKGYDNLTLKFDNMPNLKAPNVPSTSTNPIHQGPSGPLTVKTPSQCISLNSSAERYTKDKGEKPFGKRKLADSDLDDVIVLDDWHAGSDGLDNISFKHLNAFEFPPNTTASSIGSGGNSKELYYTQAAYCFPAPTNQGKALKVEQARLWNPDNVDLPVSRDIAPPRTETLSRKMDTSGSSKTIYYQDFPYDLSLLAAYNLDQNKGFNNPNLTSIPTHPELLKFFEDQTVIALSQYLAYCYQYSYGPSWLKMIPKPKSPWNPAQIFDSMKRTWSTCFRFFLNGHQKGFFEKLTIQYFDAKRDASIINIRAYSVAFTHLLNKLIKGDLHPVAQNGEKICGDINDDQEQALLCHNTYRETLSSIRKHLNRYLSAVNPS